MRTYSLVPTLFWTERSLRKLSQEARTLAFYLLSSHHTNMLGCFRLPLGYVSEDLEYSQQTVSKGFAELMQRGFVSRDEENGWIIIHPFLTWNPIENPNQGKNIQKIFDQVPKNTAIYGELVNLLLENSRHLFSEFVNRLQTLSEGFLNQEQEQDKDINTLLGNELPNDPLFENSHRTSTNEIKHQALEILSFLNQRANRQYRPVDTNLKLIIARLKSGATPLQCRQVIIRKHREWKDDPKMVEYLRPATLFNATKFEQYVGELVVQYHEETKL